MGSAPGRRSRRSRRRSQVQSRKWGKLKREQQRETGMGWAGQGLGYGGDNVQRQTIFIFPLSPQGLLGKYVEEEEGAPRQCRKYFICHALPSTARIFRLNWFKKCNSIWISFDIWHQPIPSSPSPSLGVLSSLFGKCHCVQYELGRSRASPYQDRDPTWAAYTCMCKLEGCWGKAELIAFRL